MSKYCMIEIAFNNKEEINETINVFSVILFFTKNNPAFIF